MYRERERDEGDHVVDHLDDLGEVDLWVLFVCLLTCVYCCVSVARRALRVCVILTVISISHRCWLPLRS